MTFRSPCKTFQQPVDVADAGGEFTAIDSAGFGPITITKRSSSVLATAGLIRRALCFRVNLQG